MSMYKDSVFTRRCRGRLNRVNLAAAVIIPTLVQHVAAAPPVATVESVIVPVDSATIYSNTRQWTKDYAIMFYAPWCQHCKEIFSPMWEDVAVALSNEDPKGKRKLIMAKFNCEQDDVALSFCIDIGLSHYPSFYYYGRGKFHDYDPLTGIFQGRPTAHDSSAKFPTNAAIYPDTLFDWVKAMHFISVSNRFMDKINIFRRNRMSTEERLSTEIATLKRQNEQMQKAMADGSSYSEESSSISTDLEYGFGDTYSELHAVNYAEEFAFVMQCVMDFSQQYCSLSGVKETDRWCATTQERCVALNFQDAECWPSTCPLEEQGCQIVSSCLSPDVFQLYSDAFTSAEEQLGSEEFTPDEAGSRGLGEEERTGRTQGTGAEESAADQAETEKLSALPPFLRAAPRMDRPADEGRGETVGTP